MISKNAFINTETEIKDYKLSDKEKIDLYNELKDEYSGTLAIPIKYGYKLEYDPKHSKWDYIDGSYNHYVNSNLNNEHRISLSETGTNYRKLLFLNESLRHNNGFKFKDDSDTSELIDHVIYPKINRYDNFGICYFPYSDEEMVTKELTIDLSLLGKQRLFEDETYLNIELEDINFKRFIINPNCMRYAIEGVVGFLLCPKSLERNLWHVNHCFKSVTGEEAFYFVDDVEITFERSWDSF